MAALAVIAAGCGMYMPQPSHLAPAGCASVTITVYWPEVSARLLPAGTDKLKVHVFRGGQELTRSDLPREIARGAEPQVTTTIEMLPVGPAVFSVYAYANEEPNIPLAKKTDIAATLDAGANTLDWTLDTTVAAVALSPTSATLHPTGSQLFTATATDSESRTIVGLEFSFGAVSGGYFTVTPEPGSDNTATVTGTAAGSGGSLKAWPSNDPDPAHAATAPITVTGLSSTKIAFCSNRDGNYEIYGMTTTGGAQTRLTNNTAYDAWPNWSPDGSKIAFDTDRDGNEEIYAMNADGTGQTNLTNAAGHDWAPSWSPDGSKIAFFTTRHGNWEIYVMNADGSGQTRLTNNSADDGYPSWSPDGTKIAFDSYRDGNFEIYVMNADGSGQTNLTNNSTTDWGPRWSPDGQKIAFTSNRDGNFEVYVMGADGSGPTNVTNNAAFESAPSWSPDGSKLAFNSDRPGHYDIYTVKTDGSLLMRLTSNTASDEVPSWSPWL